MTFDNLVSKKYGPYVILFVATLAIYSLIYMFSDGFGLTAHNHWGWQYARQAQSWLDGRLDIYNYSWLEIAPFNGRYYVSFPPFPSVVMLPFVAIFGYSCSGDGLTLEHTLALIFALLSTTFAYKIAATKLENKKHAIFFALFLVLGTNYLHISLWGAVWYIAQNMAFTFTLMAFYFAMSKVKWHSALSLFFMCAAMGCRPFNAVYVPIVLWLIYQREGSFSPFLRKIFIYAVPALILGAFFMWLNYARFGSIFEFGHNHLPEFVNDPDGQFYIGRIPRNLHLMFVNTDISHGILVGFPFIGQVGFAFWLASPIVVSFVVYLDIYGWKVLAKRATNAPMVWVLLALIMLHLFLFTFHRTLGGRQFGSRYAADSLPAIFLGVVLILSKLRVTANHIYLNAVPILFGLLINFHGTIMFFIYYYPQTLPQLPKWLPW